MIEPEQQILKAIDLGKLQEEEKRRTQLINLSLASLLDVGIATGIAVLGNLPSESGPFMPLIMLPALVGFVIGSENIIKLQKIETQIKKLEADLHFHNHR